MGAMDEVFDIGDEGTGNLDLVLIEGEIDDVEDDESFLPVSFSMLDSLVSEYTRARTHIQRMADFVKDDSNIGGILHHFIEGNTGSDERFHRSLYIEKLFCLEGAVASLNAAYWSKTLSLTKVLEFMPAKRREEWFNSIRECSTPTYQADIVRSTLQDLYLKQEQFFSEMIADIFHSLSRTHVTNSPLGFGKRMIIKYAVSEYGSPCSTVAGHISDLRKIIGRFSGRGEPSWSSTHQVLRLGYERHGEWIAIDGGALRLRVHLNMTVHLDVHPSVSYRLNRMLAHIYPNAIASSSRSKPKKQNKEFVLESDLIAFDVLNELSKLSTAKYYLGDDKAINDRWREIPNSLSFEYGDYDKAVRLKAEDALERLGGSKIINGRFTYWKFDYDPSETIEEVILFGRIPNDKSFQFYPTGSNLAGIAFDLANEGATDEMNWAEPSAGNGALADLMPRDRTTCFEISSVRCSILRAKGYSVVEGDFLSKSDLYEGKFARVLANPPFSQGRSLAHLEAASRIVESKGVLVMILPAGLRNQTLLPESEWDVDWSDVYENQFENTGVRVAVLRARRKF